ncbi:MAG: adenylylsulfate reductase, partial [Acutalibacteraceae bacterium]
SADEEDVLIEGTEPYIVGGHTASGYWIDNDRKTTLDGLFAAGDVAGGCPQKYVTGALAEGKIAGLSALGYAQKAESPTVSEKTVDTLSESIGRYFKNHGGESAETLEAEMQSVMDKYAGGISTYYAFSEESLNTAEEKIKKLIEESESAFCRDMHELTALFEVKERLTVCLTLISHLKARKETRWHCFAENESYPERDDENFLKFVNSKTVDGEIQIVFRPLERRS